MSENIEAENGRSFRNEDEDEKNEKSEETASEPPPETFDVKEPEITEGSVEYKRPIFRRFAVQVFSSLYCLILLSVGIVFPIAIYLSGGNFRRQGLHLAIYWYYVYGVGIAVYVFVLIRIRHHKNVMKNSTQKSHDAKKKKKPRREVYVINEDVTAIRSPEEDSNEKDISKTKDQVPTLYESPEGINFFLRLGLVAFGLAGMLLEGIRTVEFFTSHAMRDCYGPTYQVASFLKFFYIVIQTSALFKHHKICVNVDKPLSRLGVLHNVATNLATWADIVVLEAVEAYNHYVHEEASRSSGHGQSVISPTPASHSPGTTSLLTGKQNHNTTDKAMELNAAHCIAFPDTLATASSPYLFPFMVEYCLLAAAFLFRTLDNIGPAKYFEAQHEEKMKRIDRERFPDLYAHQPSATQCSRANRGLFSGLLLLIIVVTGVCFFLFFQTTGGARNEVSGTIYVISDLTFKLLVLLIIIPAFWQTRKLYFTVKTGNVLDQELLVFALFGSYLLDGFTCVAALGSVGSPDPITKAGSQAMAATTIINFVQATFLVGFIIDGLQRRSVTARHVIKKPGRGYVTFLLILNLSLWLIVTFEMKMVNRFSVFHKFYGQLGWTIIISVLGPIAIYFRFHCAVCLSDIWVHSYGKSPKEDPTEGEAEKCGKLL